MRADDPADERRLFFRYLARETVVWFEELCGKPNLQLADLPKLPTEAIGALVPQVLEGVVIVLEAGRVAAQVPGASEALELLPANETNLFVFNRFNGENTIRQVANELGVAMAWPPERSVEFVKEMFFQLVRLRVCAPANAARP